VLQKEQTNHTFTDALHSPVYIVLIRMKFNYHSAHLYPVQEKHQYLNRIHEFSVIEKRKLRY
jgi:hypothetical protein